jgi:hypothetical protein
MQRNELTHCSLCSSIPRVLICTEVRMTTSVPGNALRIHRRRSGDAVPTAARGALSCASW